MEYDLLEISLYPATSEATLLIRRWNAEQKLLYLLKTSGSDFGLLLFDCRSKRRKLASLMERHESQDGRSLDGLQSGRQCVALARREQQREGRLSKGKLAVLAVISRKRREGGLD